MDINSIGFENKVTGRNHYVLNINDFNLMVDFSIYKYFICFIAEDCISIDISQLKVFIRSLINNGMIYLCCWGKNCELIHDLADEVYDEIIGHEVFDDKVSTSNLIMTTWHQKETLAEGLWFSIYNAIPSDDFFDLTKSHISITVDNIGYSNRIISYLSDFEKLERDTNSGSTS